MTKPNISLHSWVEWTLGTKGIHPMLEALCRRYLELEEKDFKRDWPKSLHEQYLLVLDERDALQEKIDEQERLLAIYGAMADDMPTDDLFEMYEEEYDMQFGHDCEHEWDPVSINYGYGDHTVEMCTLCGAEKG